MAAFDAAGNCSDTSIAPVTEVTSTGRPIIDLGVGALCGNSGRRQARQGENDHDGAEVPERHFALIPTPSADINVRDVAPRWAR